MKAVRLLGALLCMFAVATNANGQFRPGGPGGGRPGGGPGSAYRPGGGGPGGDDRSSRGGSSSGTDRFFGYLDRNRDGRLDQDEVRRIQGPLRDSFERARIDLSKGISREQFSSTASRAFEDMRRRRDEERSQGSQGGYGQQTQPSAPKPKEKPAPKPKYTPTARPRVTVDMPSQFESGDSNVDGQLTLLEWRTWKGRTAMAEFALLDRNGDGFLIPSELANPRTESETVASDSSRRSTPPTRFSASSNSRPSKTRSKGGVSPRASSSASTSSNPAIEREANSAFGSLDSYGNKDGKVNPSEWNISKTIKPAFEKVGADLTKDMGNAEFVQIYLKAFPNGRPRRR